jgi:hypothetical protein
MTVRVRGPVVEASLLALMTSCTSCVRVNMFRRGQLGNEWCYLATLSGKGDLLRAPRIAIWSRLPSRSSLPALFRCVR